MLVINYKGNTPQQRFYTCGVQGNNKANKIKFVVAKMQDGLDLSTFACNLKVENKDHDFSDLILLDGLYDETTDTISFVWEITNKATQYKNLELQLEFLGEGEIVWQTLIAEIELNATIKVGDNKPTDKELSVLKQLEIAEEQQNQAIEKNAHDIVDLQREVLNAKEIIIGNPYDWRNKHGLDKIIREQDENGSIQKSYMIDKIVTPSTLVVCEQHREENDFDYDGSEEYLIEDLGEEDFYNLFGDDVEISSVGNLFSFYRNQNGEITKGFKFGNDAIEYGYLSMQSVKPNTTIRIVVGKYFEYDEQGNKVFDEHCAIYSDNLLAKYGVNTKEITEEKQVLELVVDDSENFYIDGDGNDLGFDNTRFILYAIETGDPEQTTYEAKEIGAGGSSLKRPTFIHRQTVNGTRSVVVDDDCRVLINGSLMKCSKTTKQGWSNSSKGNQITKITLPKGTYYYAEDFLYNVLSGKTYTDAKRGKAFTQGEKTTYGISSQILATNSDRMIYVYDRNQIRQYARDSKLFANLNRKITQRLAKSQSLNGLAVKLRLRFVRNFEANPMRSVENDSGWTGEMNANQLEVIMFDNYNNGFVLVVMRWLHI